MCVDLAVYRARIGRFNSLIFKCVKSNSALKKSKHVLFFGIVCCILLIIGGVELNPGPADEVTLQDIWEKLNGLDDIKRDITDLNKSVSDWSKSIATLRADTDKVTAECQRLSEENSMLRGKLDQLENQSRRSNVVFYNVQESENETWQDTENTVKDIVQNNMKVELNNYDIERAHRIGRKGNRDRPIIVKFNNYKKKSEVLDARKNLTGLQIGLAEDYSELVREKREKLKGYMLNAKNKGHRASLRFDKLVVDGRYYTIEDLIAANAPCDSIVPKPRPQRQQQTENETPPEMTSSTEDRDSEETEEAVTDNQTDNTQGRGPSTQSSDLRQWLLPGRVTTRSQLSTKGRKKQKN